MKLVKKSFPKRVVVIPFLFIILFTILIWHVSLHAASTTGIVSGKLVDAETGDPLIGANVMLKGTTFGSSSDLDGNYRIASVPPGEFVLRISYMGYQTKEVSGIFVNIGQVTRMNAALSMQVLAGEEVVVTAKAMKNNETILLKDRQKAVAVSDAISAEAISQAGAGDAAEAMKQITGASVVDGKYIYVRGLGDRYTSTQLNGAEIPSTDPYKRGGSLDLVPSNLVDNIATVKSFTPDKPGDFSGGTVDIKTKDFPDYFTLSFSASTSYNPMVNLNADGPIGYSGSATDWLGKDDGLRDVPLSDDAYIPDLGSAGKDYETALELDRMTKMFNYSMVPKSKTPPLNQSYSFSLGNQVNFLNRSLGFLASLSYKRKQKSYDSGVYQRWTLSSGVADFLSNDFDLSDTKTSDEVLWGALLKGSYKLSQNHVISLNTLINQNGESSARHLIGKYPYDLSIDDDFITSELAYTERLLQSYQLKGQHFFPFLGRLKMDWRASAGSLDQEEPDRRFFTAFRNKKGYYGIATNVPPARYYRDMNEKRDEFGVDFELPFRQWLGMKSSFKFGALMADKEREFTERNFEYQQEPVFKYDGDADVFFSDANTGLVDSTILTIAGKTYKRYDFGLIIRENFIDGNWYQGNQDISAYYMMLDMPLSSRIRMIGGVRYETTDLMVDHNAVNQPLGELKTQDWLPSLNLIYAMTDRMNVRAAYGRTLARPNIREIAPYASFDFVGGTTYIGNPKLKRTLVNNFDLRWEWFSRPGEIYAVSGFYKKFQYPVEPVIFNDKHYIRWENVDEADVYGAEFEIRKRLDVIYSKLSNFQIGTNITLVHSLVDISEEQLRIIHETRPEADHKRAFQGQSPYLLNMNFSYDNVEKGLNASLYYNVFGKRLSVVSLGGTPDVYETPFSLLNFNLSWRLAPGVQAKIGGTNLLNSKMKKIQEFNGTEYIYEMHDIGRTYSVGLKYDM